MRNYLIKLFLNNICLILFKTFTLPKKARLYKQLYYAWSYKIFSTKMFYIAPAKSWIRIGKNNNKNLYLLNLFLTVQKS